MRPRRALLKTPARTCFQARYLLHVWRHTGETDMNRNILLVDADASFVGTLTAALKAEGFEVTAVPDGAGAVNVVRINKPDLIILDLFYPPETGPGAGIPWDGFLIVEWMRRIADLSGTRVIFTTAEDPAQYEDRASKAGASGLFQKGSDIGQLLSAVRGYLGEPAPAA